MIIDIKEDFRVFDQPDHAESSKACLPHQVTVQVSIDQEIMDVLEGMVLQKRTLNLLALLESHVGSATLELTVGLLPLSCLGLPLLSLERKRKKRDKKFGKEVSEEGEIQPSME